MSVDDWGVGLLGDGGDRDGDGDGGRWIGYVYGSPLDEYIISLPLRLLSSEEGEDEECVYSERQRRFLDKDRTRAYISVLRPIFEGESLAVHERQAFASLDGGLDAPGLTAALVILHVGNVCDV